MPVVITPPNEADAGCKFNVLPDIVAPFALAVAPIAASVVTPVFNVCHVLSPRQYCDVVPGVIAGSLLLNVFQSVLDKYPLAKAEADGIDIVFTDRLSGLVNVSAFSRDNSDGLCQSTPPPEAARAKICDAEPPELFLSIIVDVPAK